MPDVAYLTSRLRERADRRTGRHKGRTILALLGVLVAAAGCAGPYRRASAELDARRLIGRGYYENDQFTEAARQFRRCIQLAPDSAVDRFNLGLVLMRAAEYERALTVLEQARRLDPDLLGVYYLEGIIHKRCGRFERAAQALRQVLEHDPRCRGAYYNLGVCYKFMQRYERALECFAESAQLQPTDPSTHYQLITLYRRLGDVESAERHKEIYDRVKDTVDASEKTVEALERSKYTYIMEALRLTPGLSPRPPGRVRFVEVSASAGLQPPLEHVAPPIPPSHFTRDGYDPEKARELYVPSVGGAVALGDYDGDGDLDLYVVNCAADPAASANRLFRNDGRAIFTDVTDAAGVGDAHLGTHAVFGDYDNDGHDDLYVVNCGPNVLYHNQGDGTFQDVSRAARADEPQFGRRAVFFDYDHDHDLDLFVANDVALSEPPDQDHFALPADFPGEANTLLRNNGDGTFTDLTDEAGLLVELARTRDALFADFDGDYDIDLLVINSDAPALLFANARMGRFEVGGRFSPPIDNGAYAVTEADFNHDSKPDLLIDSPGGLYLYLNDGQGNFAGTPLPRPDAFQACSVDRIAVFDFNNDGWSDLLLAGAEVDSVALLAGAGAGKFSEVSHRVGLGRRFGGIADLATGDLDGDGDQDLVLKPRGSGAIVLSNETPAQAGWLSVHLLGRKVNRDAFGATVEIAAGGHYRKQTVRRSPVHFGLGPLQCVDLVRITWPNGVAQNVIRPELNTDLIIEEQVKVSASCGFLYAWNGMRFELVNEILGVGPLGVPKGPGAYHQPDCTELTRIAGPRLAARHGYYDLRLTEELREITYADQVTLRVVDHPAELEIIPNEMFTAPPFPEDKFFALAEHRVPRSAFDDRGNDVLALIRHRDGRWPTFAQTAYQGVARPHAITLDLGDLSGAGRVLLFLDGWIYWPESSTVMAVAQDPRVEITPLSLEVRDQQGRWRTAIQAVGLPTSKGTVVPVDLSGCFGDGGDYRVRLSTTMCVYFDRIFVATGDESARCRRTELPVAWADLHYRGFSEMTREPSGYERFDYDRVSPAGSWNPPRGLFTRYGEVTELLRRPDNRYVILGPGDELALRFDAASLPEPPPGWTRDFIFYANGWVKDGDLNTRFSETVGPLPFHGMSGYPYPPEESYPDTPELRAYLRTFNTRPDMPTTGSLR